MVEEREFFEKKGTPGVASFLFLFGVGEPTEGGSVLMGEGIGKGWGCV